jgi:hypothetical protein
MSIDYFRYMCFTINVLTRSYENVLTGLWVHEKGIIFFILELVEFFRLMKPVPLTPIRQLIFPSLSGISLSLIGGLALIIYFSAFFLLTFSLFSC